MFRFMPPFRTAVATRASVRPVLRPGQVSVSASGFHNSSSRSALKESDRNNDNLEQKYDSEKENNLRSVKDGKAKWNHELASDSEATVKAERGEIDVDEFGGAKKDETQANESYFEKIKKESRFSGTDSKVGTGTGAGSKAEKDEGVFDKLKKKAGF